MQTSVRSLGLVGFLLLVALATAADSRAQEPPAPQAREIPGITADDQFPQACVSCHVVLPDGMDVRLSTLLGQMTEGVDSALLALAQSTAPSGVTLVGQHPDARVAVSNIPASCLPCHGTDSKLAPPFGRLMHRIHLTGGEQSVFLSMFQGECTHCHKLDMSSGAWSIPSGSEP